MAPLGLQVDRIHPGEGPHLHLPNDYDRPVALGPFPYEAARLVLMRHLERFDEPNLDVLIQELTAR